MSSFSQGSTSIQSRGGGRQAPEEPNPLIRRRETESGSRSISAVDPEPSTAKKKRNLPGNPDPSAEVIALSPGTLMATNRFTCEICNKGFQREQNLQLHRRGHNLPWKLRQRTAGAEVRKRVFVCPEPTCVHHNPARALGDLTGIKKHYCRKHGEKKWRCERCSKRYAVQSDWKAHMKTCGTKEYRCDCGSIFSRRDSFITHRAFCNALSEESHKILHQNDQTTLVSPPLPFQPPYHHRPTATSTHPPPMSTAFLHSNDLKPFPTTYTCEPNPQLLPTTQHLHLNSSSGLLEKMAQVGATATAELLHHHHPYGGGGSELENMVWAHQRGGDGATVDFMGVAEKRRRQQTLMAPPLHPLDM